MYNCAERVQNYFTDVDNLNARVMAVKVKNKTRRVPFTEIGSPPEPIVTRWSTWIASAEHYAENIVQVKEIVDSFSTNGILVQKAKEAVNNEIVLASREDQEGLTTLCSQLSSRKWKAQSTVVARHTVTSTSLILRKTVKSHAINRQENEQEFGCECHHGTLETSS